MHAWNSSAVMDDTYSNQRITVMGLGRFGGGVGVTRFLAARGAVVTVTDQETGETLCDSVAQLADLPGLTYRLGGHHERDFIDADLIVANPAVKPDHPMLLAARRSNVPITTEIALLVQHLPSRARTIGITGSAGKSTTTAMTGHLLRRAQSAGCVHVGGNLGGSLLHTVHTMTPDDWIVLELSSFMLHYLRQARWSPHIAVITNITPNHLDWHGSLEAYTADKLGILEHQQPGDTAIFGPSLHHLNTHATRIDTTTQVALHLPGSHNTLNAQTALTILRAVGMSPDPLRDLLDFQGLPHRLQYVGQRDGVRFYNDSKCTTPEAAVLAIDAFPPQTVHLLLGGYDKGSDFAKLAQHAADRCAGVYTLGHTGDRIAELVGLHAHRCGTLEIAVQRALQNAKPGESVVLSPACASWDQYENYEKRGEHFVNLCKEAHVL